LRGISVFRLIVEAFVDIEYLTPVIIQWKGLWLHWYGFFFFHVRSPFYYFYPFPFFGLSFGCGWLIGLSSGCVRMQRAQLQEAEMVEEHPAPHKLLVAQGPILWLVPPFYRQHRLHRLQFQTGEI
jgi:hypothetical protein